MKFIQKITLLSLCFTFVPSIVFADPLTYEVQGKKVTVVECDLGASGTLVIPTTFQGKPVTRIGNNAFDNCDDLTSVIIPDSVTSIGADAFAFCADLTSVTIGNSVTSIGVDAFYRCMMLRSITIPDSVTSIGSGAFYDCFSLKSVTIGRGVTSSLKGMFSDSSELTSIEVSKGNINYSSENGVLFDKNKTELIKFPVAKSGHYTIPDSVTSIESWAFVGCSSLTNVTIPENVTQIGRRAFSGCSSLKSITFEGNAPSSFGSDVFKYLPIGATITVTAGATGFDETYGGLTVQILKKKLVIKYFNNHATPFSLTFETKSDSTYKIEGSHDLKKWGELGEVQGTGSSVEFTDWREALFQKQYYRLKLVD